MHCQSYWELNHHTNSFFVLYFVSHKSESEPLINSNFGINQAIYGMWWPAMFFTVVTYGCESWTVKKAEHQRIDALNCDLEKTLESPLDCKKIQPVPPKGDQSWVFIGRTDVEAQTPILWPPDVKSWLIWKDPDAGKDWVGEEKGTTEDEMVGWHYWLNGHVFGWTPGVDDGQGGLVCCGSRGRKELDTTEWLNWIS